MTLSLGNPADLFSYARGKRAGAGVVEGVAGRGTARDRQGLVASAMAMAGGNAAVSRHGWWPWEIRTDLPTKRTARVLICLYGEHLVALHGFIKKSRATPDEDLALARKRKKELEQ